MKDLEAQLSSQIARAIEAEERVRHLEREVGRLKERLKEAESSAALAFVGNSDANSAQDNIRLVVRGLLHGGTPAFSEQGDPPPAKSSPPERPVSKPLVQTNQSEKKADSDQWVIPKKTPDRPKPVPKKKKHPKKDEHPSEDVITLDPVEPAEKEVERPSLVSTPVKNPPEAPWPAEPPRTIKLPQDDGEIESRIWDSSRK